MRSTYIPRTLSILILSLSKDEARSVPPTYAFSFAALRPAMRPKTWPETRPVPAG
jgi:hypothetical protein